MSEKPPFMQQSFKQKTGTVLLFIGKVLFFLLGAFAKLVGRASNATLDYQGFARRDMEDRQMRDHKSDKKDTF